MPNKSRVMVLIFISAILLIHQLMSFFVYIPHGTFVSGEREAVSYHKAHYSKLCPVGEGETCRDVKKGSVMQMIIFDVVPFLILAALFLLGLGLLSETDPRKLADHGRTFLQVQRVLGYVYIGSLMLLIFSHFVMEDLLKMLKDQSGSDVSYSWHLGMYLGVANLFAGIFVSFYSALDPQMAGSAGAAPYSPGLPPPPPLSGLPAPAALPGVVCPKCAAVLTGDARFCTSCGKTIIRACPTCQKSCAPDAKFCKDCGTVLNG